MSNDQFYKKNLVANQVQNEVFHHFLEFGSYVFLEIEYHVSLRQCLTPSRGKTHEKSLGPKFGPNGPKSGQKLGFLPFSQVRFKDDSLELCLTTSRGKTDKNIRGPKLDLKFVFLPFSEVCIISFS